MRFVTRILIGATAAAVLAVGAPAAANASAVTTASPVAPAYEADWGPYFSGDHKASASGHVSVEKKSYKTWIWKTFYKKVQVCWKDKWDKKHCKWVVKKFKKKVPVWKHDYFYSVDSTLTNHHWWGKRKFVCAWEVFKVENFDGSTYFKSFKNCNKGDADYSFAGKNAEHIWVNVSRGSYGKPNGFYSGWQSVYHAP